MARASGSHRALDALGHLADTVVLGLLVTATSLPMVTAPAALSAAVAVVSDLEREGPAAVVYLRALRRTWRTGTAVGAVAAVLLAVGATDVWWATRGPLTVLSTPVLAAGVLLMLVTAATACTAAGQLASTPPGTPMRSVLSGAAITAAAAPARTAFVATAAVLCGATVAVVPVCAPLAAGLLVHCLRRVAPLPPHLIVPTRPLRLTGTS